MIIASRKACTFVLLALAVCLSTLLYSAPSVKAMEGLPPGIDMDTISDIGQVLSTCNGDFGDIVSLYMVEANPLIEKVKAELKQAKETEKALKEAAAADNSSTTEVIAQSKDDAAIDDIEMTEAEKEANKESGGAMATAIMNILDSDEWNALLTSETLKRISDNLDLACVMEDETFVELFDGIVASQNITEDSDLYPIIQDAPEMVAGYYDCGGRILTGLNFVDGVVPDLVKAGGFDPMAVLSSPAFEALTGSGFDMSCFFGVPEVGALLAGVMG